MYQTAERNGKNVTIKAEDSAQDRLLAVLYRHAAGRAALRLLVSRPVSEFGGWLLDSSVSRILIPAFIRSHSIHMEDFEQKKYSSYNDFFTRKLRMTGGKEARHVEMADELFISPCDSRLSIYKIDKQCAFSIKHTGYTVQSLLRQNRLAQAYAGGYIWIFRLCVDDYHRYIYVDCGKVSAPVQIPGVFHTVNPVANEYFPVYKENAREYCLLKSEHFGTLLQMEVGAMFVGKIKNHPVKEKDTVQRGQEKGYFAFGGSTVVLMTQPGKVCPDEDILDNSRRGIETKVKLGERIGESAAPSTSAAFLS